MTTPVEIVIKGRDESGGAFASAQGGLAKIGQIAAGIVASQVFNTLANSFMDMTRQAFEAIGNYERLTASIETLTARELTNSGAANSMTEALAMAAPRAKELLDWIQKLAIKSPFTQDSVAVALRTALAYGFTTEQAQRLTQATIDFAAGSGAGEDAMNRIMLALGQIQARGKLSGQEILQLVNAGIPVTQVLAKAFNVTTAEITKMSQEGLIPADKAIEAIINSLETDFAGAAERQTETWAGLTSTFQDLKEIGLRKLFDGLAESIKPLAVNFSNWMQGEGFARLEKMGAIVGEITSEIITLAESFQGVNNAASGFITPFIPAVRSIMDTFEKMRPSIEKTAQVLGEKLVKAGRELYEKVFPFLVQTLDKFALWFAENRPLIEAFVSKMAERFAAWSAAVVGFWNVVEPILSGLFDLILGLVELIMEIATGDWAAAWETIKEIVVGVFTSLGEAIVAFLD